MSLTGLLLVGCAGAAAGAVNAVAGGGSLISFPALLLTGLSPLAANVTNTVGLVPGYLGATLGYRDELAGQARRLLVLGAAAGTGAIVGCALLLAGSPAVFNRAVPFLVLGACALLAVQPRVAAWLRRRDGGQVRERQRLLTGAVLLAGVYASYFGAGLGVALLALLGVLVRDGLQRLNALKAALSLAASSVGAVVFAVIGPVHLAAAAVLAAGSLVGGRYGAGVARRLPERLLRVAVLVIGVVVGVALLLR